MLRFKIIIVFIFYCSVLFSQESRISEQVTAVAEEIASYENVPLLTEIFAEMLNDLIDNRIRINSGNENELRRLFFLSEFAIKSIADYVRTTGPVYSLNELANIPGLNKETAEMILPFITLEVTNESNEERSGIRHSLLTNFILKPGTRDSLSPGSPVKVLARYKFTTGHFSGGFTAEKDPGEKFRGENLPVTDFFSFHFSYNGKGFLKKVIIGDYSARFGLGIAVNSSLSAGFSLTSPGNLSGKNEIRSYTSSDENNYFRGIATVLGIKNIEFSVLYSSNNIDAIINRQSDTSALTIRNLYTRGYHNTQSTIRNKDVLRETCTGANLTINAGNIKTGLTVFNNHFSLPFQPDFSDPASIYDFSGRSSTLYSFYYNSVFKRIIFSGEISSADFRGYGLTQALAMRPSDRLSISFLYRKFSPGYISFHGKGPGASGSITNETGFSGSFTFEAAKNLFLSAGGDIRTYPWLRYRCSFPSSARRYEVRIKYLPTEKFNLETIYQYRLSETDDNESSGIPSVKETVLQTFRIHAKYTPVNNITFATRVDFKKADPDSGSGALLLQDLVVKSGKIPVSIWFRYCVFNTKNYESGIYTWENDLLYSYSIPVLYGRGTRNYILVKWEPFNFADLRIKYGFTSASPGNAEEEFHDEIKLQLYLRF